MRTHMHSSHRAALTVHGCQVQRRVRPAAGRVVRPRIDVSPGRQERNHDRQISANSRQPQRGTADVAARVVDVGPGLDEGKSDRLAAVAVAAAAARDRVFLDQARLAQVVVADSTAVQEAAFDDLGLAPVAGIICVRSFLSAQRMSLGADPCVDSRAFPGGDVERGGGAELATQPQ